MKLNILFQIHTEAKRKRAVVWDRLAYLAESGVTTGSRLLDRMIAQGRDSIEIAQYTYFSRTVPTPAQHFERQDPGEAGSNHSSAPHDEDRRRRI